jgi:3-oxoadipate enol-lactonase
MAERDFLLICVPGGPGMDSGYFHPYLDRLNEAYSTQFVDLRGSSIEEYVEQISQIRARAGARPAIVLGHSFGAAVVTEFVAAHPTAAAAMILIAPMYDAAWLDEFMRDFGERNSRILQSIKGMKLQDPDAEYKEHTKALVDLYFQKDHLAAGMRLLDAIKYDGGVSDRLSSYVETLDLKDKLRHVAIPSLFIAGQDDQIIRTSYISAGAALVPNALLRVVPDAGHFPFVEKPEAVAALITDFIAACSGQGRFNQ